MSFLLKTLSGFRIRFYILILSIRKFDYRRLADRQTHSRSAESLELLFRFEASNSRLHQLSATSFYQRHEPEMTPFLSYYMVTTRSAELRNHVQEVLHSLQLHNYTRQSVDQIFTKILLDFDPAQPGTGYSTISKAVQTRIKPLPTKVTMICAPVPIFLVRRRRR